MAFANLFTKLSAVDEDLKSPCPAAMLHRTGSDEGKRVNVRKRKGQCDQTDPYNQKPCYQVWKSRTYNRKSFKDDGSNHMQNNKHANAALAEEVAHNLNNNCGSHMYSKGQNHNAENKRNMNRHHQQKWEGQKNPHQKRNKQRFNKGGRHQSRGRGGNGEYEKGKQVKRARSMTQEFIQQNALVVDEQLLCRHFIWGRCTMGDECQFKHILGCNDLIKEACKFYIQGQCTKGESCPYMHKSFPCKFFHGKGKCSQGADCRFSHEPLNETTNRLLEETLQHDNDLRELAKKAEEESLGQPASTDQSEITEAKKTLDALQPFRLTFYNREETNTVQETSLSKSEELPEIAATAVPPQASSSNQPHSPVSSNLNHNELVCYSVEAVLGPQLYKPLNHQTSFTTQRSQESESLSGPQNSSDCAIGSAPALQSQVLSSVDTVWSCKSSGSAIFGHIYTPPSRQNLLIAPSTDCKELTNSLRSSDTENGAFSSSAKYESNESQEKMSKRSSSVQVHTDLISETCPGLSLNSGNIKKQSVDITESLKEKGDLQGNNNSKAAHPFTATNNKGTTFTPTYLTSGLTSNARAPVKPSCPSTSFSEYKCTVPVTVAEPVTGSAKTSDTGNSVTHHLVAKRRSDMERHPKTLQLGSKPDTPPYCTETTAECSSKVAQCGDISVDCKRTQRSPFYSLFASPLTDSLKPVPNFLTNPPSSRASAQSSCPPTQRSRDDDTHFKTGGEGRKATTTSFLRLFTTPLCAAPQLDDSLTAPRSSRSNQSAASHLPVYKQRDKNSKMPLPHQVESDVKQISHSPQFSKRSPTSKNKDDLSEAVSRPNKQQVKPDCSPVSKSVKGSTVAAAPAGSVLKTLFRRLGPFVPDGEREDSIQSPMTVPSEDDKKDVSYTGCVSVHQKRKKKRGTKNQTPNPHQQSTEQNVAHSPELQTSSQTSLIHLKATAGSTLGTAAVTEPQERHTGTHNLPFKPVMQQMRHHTSEGGNVASRPFRDLFRSLDTTVFDCEH